MSIELKIMRLPHSEGIDLPRYETSGSAGFDLCAAISGEQMLHSGEITLIPTGFIIAIAQGYEGQVRPRSGLALKHGITLPNSPATIDSDYRGELQIPLINLSNDSFKIVPRMRIAQMVIAAIEQVNLIEVTSLDATTRGSGGFGSTGV